MVSVAVITVPFLIRVVDIGCPFAVTQYAIRNTQYVRSRNLLRWGETCAPLCLLASLDWPAPGV